MLNRNLIKIYALLIFFAFANQNLILGQDKNTIGKASHELRLQNLKPIIDSIVAKEVKKNGPGLSVGIIYKGKRLLDGYYGLMNLDYNLPVNENTAYNLASVSKHITAFGILLLESQGKLKMNDSIGKYIINLPGNQKNITISQLLHHTGGIPSTDILKIFGNISFDDHWTFKDEMELLHKFPQLNFEPGTEFMYSNGGYSLLATVIEQVSGEDFAAFFKKEVLEPLGLHAEVYNYTGKIIKNRAKGYTTIDEQFVSALSESESVYGPTNCYFSMKDMLRWMNCLMGNGTKFNAIFNKMKTPAFILPSGKMLNYSYGLDVSVIKGVKSISHSGGTPGYASFFNLFTEHDLGIAVMSNNQNTDVINIANKITDAILVDYIKEALPAAHREIKIKELQLQKWVGSYRMFDGVIVKTIIKEHKLFLVLPDAPNFQLHPESADHYFIKEFDAQITFTENEKKKPVQLNLIQGADVQVGKFVDSNEVIIVTQPLSLFKGLYNQPQLGVTYEVVLEDGRLIIKLPATFKKSFGFSEIKLTAIGGDTFNSGRLGIVEFIRNENQYISGLKFKDVGRLRNIRFLKIK
jgi:CubicO group peptidase (beta-lactamase class C family)